MCINCIIFIYVLLINKNSHNKGGKQMDAGGSCSHARNKIRYFGGLEFGAAGASVFGVTD